MPLTANPWADVALRDLQNARTRVADLESLASRLADALAHACDRLERCDARLLRLSGEPCEGPVGEVARGRALVDEACLSQLRGRL